jgi:hypothetical protein
MIQESLLDGPQTHSASAFSLSYGLDHYQVACDFPYGVRNVGHDH